MRLGLYIVKTFHDFNGHTGHVIATWYAAFCDIVKLPLLVIFEIVTMCILTKSLSQFVYITSAIENYTPISMEVTIA